MSQRGPVIVDGIIYSAWLFIAAVGLTLVYGVMKILNVTHGSFYALGAYAGASLTGAATSVTSKAPASSTAYESAGG